MRLTGISNKGLAVIGILVSILWGCILAERTIRRQAWEETVLMLRSSRTVPIRAPYGPQKRGPARPAVQRSRGQVDLKV